MHKEWELSAQSYVRQLITKQLAMLFFTITVLPHTIPIRKSIPYTCTQPNEKALIWIYPLIREV